MLDSYAAFISATLTLASPTDQFTLEVRLKTHLTSYESKKGSRFECVVIKALEIDGRVVVPPGTKVLGTVRRASSVGIGLLRERARLDLAFEQYETPDGRRFPLTGRLTSIDNSREQVSQQGVIKGVLAAKQPNQFLFGVWERPSLTLISHSLIGLTGASNQIWEKFELGPIGAGAMMALRCVLIRFPEPEIHLPPGADMKLVVTLPPAALGGQPVAPVQRASEDLEKWIQGEPHEVDRSDGRPAGDIINMVFLGSRDQVRNAFQAAGWLPADPSNKRNLSHTFSSFNVMRQYPNAPVSMLLYKGVEPEMVFEKSLNTVTKRHHIRIWRAGVVDGNDVWVGAATHDTGVAFHVPFSFTHKIDTNIDDERTKVMTDLTFAGCGLPQMNVSRADAAATTQQGSIYTDGSASVMPLEDCKTDGFDQPPGPAQPGNRVSRLARRFFLESRNHLLRENPYYWTYEFVKHHISNTTANAVVPLEALN
jgi:hypothetical protein